MLDDTPIVPGETRPAFGQEDELRQILTEAEDELRAWQPTWEDLPVSGTPTTAAGVPASVDNGASHKEHEKVPESASTIEGEGLDAEGDVKAPVVA